MGNSASKRLPWTYQQLNCLDMPPSSESENSADDIAEYAATFLQSKRWEAEVGSFLDEHCISFVGFDDDSKIEHTRLHGEYADLVQRVLQQRFGEMGISTADALAVCGPSSPLMTTHPLKKATIEQLAAREDFAVFKGMMVRRNLELEAELRKDLESEDMPEKAEILQPHGESTSELSECLDGLCSTSVSDEKDAPTVSSAPTPTPAQTPSFSINPKDMDEYEYVEDEQLRLLFAATNKILASPEVAKSKAASEVKDPPPNSDILDKDSASKPPTRDEYLRQHRDLLVARKKEEREKQSAAGNPTSPASARPSKLPSLSPGLSPPRL